MMKCRTLLTYTIIIASVLGTFSPMSSLYADDSDYYRMRGISSKRTDQLFNEIAIRLLNGKSHLVSLDNMVEIIKNFNIIEFHSKDIEPAEEIVLKEVAFRMLKQHYLPRIGDKIRVYQLNKKFLRDVGISHREAARFESNIILPLEIATMRGQEQLKTIYWSNLVMQISTAIEKLWLKRIGYTRFTSDERSDNDAFFQAAVFLRRKFIQGDTGIADLKDNRPANEIIKAAEEKIESWMEKGIVRTQDLPMLIEIIIQYIIFSNSRKASLIADEIKAFRDINGLKEVLQYRIEDVAEIIKSHNPTDYAAFAMLQSLLQDIHYYLSLFSNTSSEGPTKIDLPKSHHSA